MPRRVVVHDEAAGAEPLPDVPEAFVADARRRRPSPTITGLATPESTALMRATGGRAPADGVDDLAEAVPISTSATPGG